MWFLFDIFTSFLIAKSHCYFFYQNFSTSRRKTPPKYYNFPISFQSFGIIPAFVSDRRKFDGIFQHTAYSSTNDDIISLCKLNLFFTFVALFIFLLNKFHFFVVAILVVLMFPNVYMVLIISRCKFSILCATCFTSFCIRWNCLGNGNVEKKWKQRRLKVSPWMELKWNFLQAKNWAKHSGCLGMNNEREKVWT